MSEQMLLYEIEWYHGELVSSSLMEVRDEDFLFSKVDREIRRILIMAELYNHKVIEKKWQNYWEENETFKTDVWDFSKPKYYALDMFPYPSGVGLHAGHP